MISIIAAVARGNVIGSGNAMPWHIPEDLRRFKAITTGHPVVMGRKTFESLGRPLPGRTNVVITRSADFRPEGCRVAGSLEEALGLFPEDEEVFVIGGGEIYRQAMAVADRLYITWVEGCYDGDTFFPEFDQALWEKVFSERHAGREAGAPAFEFADYLRREHG